MGQLIRLPFGRKVKTIVIPEGMKLARLSFRDDAYVFGTMLLVVVPTVLLAKRILLNWFDSRAAETIIAAVGISVTAAAYFVARKLSPNWGGISLEDYIDRYNRRKEIEEILDEHQ